MTVMIILIVAVMKMKMILTMVKTMMMMIMTLSSTQSVLHDAMIAGFLTSLLTDETLKKSTAASCSNNYDRDDCLMIAREGRISPYVEEVWTSNPL